MSAVRTMHNNKVDDTERPHITVRTMYRALSSNENADPPSHDPPWEASVQWRGKKGRCYSRREGRGVALLCYFVREGRGLVSVICVSFILAA